MKKLVALILIIGVISCYARMGGLGFGGIMFGGGPEGGGGDGDYSYFRNVTIKSNVAASTTLYDFPVIVHLEAENLAWTNNPGGHVNNQYGYDIAFTNSEWGLLNWDIESYNTNGTLWAWVRIPYLTNNADTVIQMVYGGTNESAIGQATNVWQDYVAVWHLDHTNAAGEYVDSTPYTNNLYEANQNPPTYSDGQVAGGTDWATDAMYCANKDNFNVFTNATSVSTWLTFDTMSQWRYVWSRRGNANELRQVQNSSTNIQSRWYTVSDNTTMDASPLSSGPWYHVMHCYDGTNIRSYANGRQSDISSISGPIEADSNTPAMGAEHAGIGAGYFWDGDIDEFRVDKYYRNADWVFGCFTNQVDVLGTVLVCPESNACSYAHTRTITVDKDIAPETLYDFPLLVSFSIPNMAEHVKSPYGYDIIFTNSEWGMLDHEVENYETNGTLVAWVRIPYLTNSADTEFIMAYGGEKQWPSREQVTNVWDSNFIGVWHLSEPELSGTNFYYDSSKYAHHGHTRDTSEGPQRYTGVAGYCQLFDGDKDEIQIYTGAVEDFDIKTGEQRTWECWMAVTNFEGADDKYLCKSDAYDFQRSRAHDGSTQTNYLNARLDLTSGNSSLSFTNTPADDGSWHYYFASWNNSSYEHVAFADWIDFYSRSDSFPVSTNGSRFRIGGDGTVDMLNGVMDEARVSTVCRSTNWAFTTWTNMLDPGGTVSVGGQDGRFVLPEAPLAWFRPNGTNLYLPTDHSGNGYTMAAYPSAVTGPDREVTSTNIYGDVIYTFDYNGSTEHFENTSWPETNLFSSGGTVLIWADADTYGDYHYFWSFQFDNNIAANEPTIGEYISGSGAISLFVQHTDSSYDEDIDGACGYNWNLIAVTFTNNAETHYVNNVEEGSMTMPLTGGTFLYFYIGVGWQYNANSMHWDGNIGDVMIFDKILSTNECIAIGAAICPTNYYAEFPYYP